MARFQNIFEGKPFRYRPISAADIMPDDNAAGSMAALTNLVPNPSSDNQWVCRPGAVQLPSSTTQQGWIAAYPLTPQGGTVSANWRVVIPSAQLPVVAVTNIVVGIHIGPGTIGASLDSLWIGPKGAPSPCFDGTQKQFTFNGAPNVTNINGEQYLVSDPLNYPYDHTKDLVIAFHVSNMNVLIQERYAQTGVTSYGEATLDIISDPFADESGLTTPTLNFNTYTNSVFFVQWIYMVYNGVAQVSCMKVIGDRVYGMVFDQGTHDVPFVYDLTTQQPVTISGVNSAVNCPTAAPASGSWQPPIIDNVGSKVVVAHPGFNGAGNGYFGWIDISTFNSPSWHSGNTTGNLLPSPPKAVRQFNNRMWYLVAGTPDVAYASDNTNFQNINNTGILPAITCGDDTPINAMQVLGLHNILGGITHALLFFKANNVYQLTGDFGVSAGATTIGSILLNSLNIAVGTTAPLSAVPTPRGVAFLSADGYRIIDWDGKISDPIGEAGKGVVSPFTNSLIPSRVCAACNGQSIRITTQNNAILGQPFQEWVFDIELKKWHGPHTFPANVIEAWKLSYVMNPVGMSGLWQSDIIPNTQSQYTENGVPLGWTFQTALIPNEDTTSELSMVETTIYVAGGVIPQNFSVSASSAQGANSTRHRFSPRSRGLAS